MKEGKQTTNLASISLSKVKALPVALPPREAAQRGDDPFLISQAGTVRTLELIPSLQKRRSTRAKHLYVYEV